MKTHNVRGFVLVGCLAAGWLGCSVDAGTEAPSSVSQAEVLPPSCTAPPGTPPPPPCGNGPRITVWARCHEGDATGYQSAYTDSFPLSYGNGGANTDPTVHTFELAVAAAGSDGYAYEVTANKYAQNASEFHVAVGLNQWDVPVESEPPSHNDLFDAQAPATCSWYSEYSLTEEYSTVYPVDSRILQCVEVVSFGNGYPDYTGCQAKGTPLGAFSALIWHDPNGPNWIKP